MLFGDQARETAGLTIEQLAEFEQDARAGQWRRRSPGGKGRGRGLDRPIDFAGAGESNAAAPFARCRVVHVAPAPARPLGVLPFDIVMDIAHADALAR